MPFVPTLIPLIDDGFEAPLLEHSDTVPTANSADASRALQSAGWSLSTGTRRPRIGT